jgi:predicted DCC family thiol-disulfide oxidoreductase YuxK
MTNDQRIVLFDGLCSLCDHSVQFIIKRDPRGLFRFASLQSDVGRELCHRHGLDPDDMSTMVYIDGADAYVRSDAALRIARRLKGPVRCAGLFLWIPRPIRNLVYRLVAGTRHQIWGKKEQCAIPSSEIADRFLD